MPEPVYPPQSGPQSTPPVVPPPAGAVPDSTPIVNPIPVSVSEMEFAGFGARFLASTVDGMVVGAIYFVLMIPVFISAGMMASSGGRQEPGMGISILMLFFQGVGLILTTGYYIYFTGKGQTLGKKVLKIRVVRVENGEAPGYTKAFLREAVGKMLSALAFGLGYLWMLWDGKKQTWHDKIGGTVVVKV